MAGHVMQNVLHVEQLVIEVILVEDVEVPELEVVKEEALLGTVAV